MSIRVFYQQGKKGSLGHQRDSNFGRQLLPLGEWKQRHEEELRTWRPGQGPL